MCAESKKQDYLIEGDAFMAISTDAKELKRAYEREWRKKNPDKCKAIRERYWEKRLAKMKAEENTACNEIVDNGVMQE